EAETLTLTLSAPSGSSSIVSRMAVFSAHSVRPWILPEVSAKGMKWSGLTGLSMLGAQRISASAHQRLGAGGLEGGEVHLWLVVEGQAVVGDRLFQILGHAFRLESLLRPGLAGDGEGNGHVPGDAQGVLRLGEQCLGAVAVVWKEGEAHARAGYQLPPRQRD